MAASGVRHLKLFCGNVFTSAAGEGGEAFYIFSLESLSFYRQVSDNDGDDKNMKMMEDKKALIVRCPKSWDPC